MNTDPRHPYLWRVAKWLCYLGGLLVAMCAAMLGFFETEPPDWLWYTAIFLVGIGVIVGNFVAYRSSQ